MQRPMVFTLICLGLMQTAQATELATYRATYSLIPSHIIKGTSAEPLDGIIAYEMSGSGCKGYSVASKFSSRFAEGETGIKTVDLIAKTNEQSDGRIYDVEQEYLVNGIAVDVTELTARRLSLTGSGEIQSKGSKKENFVLAANVLFPTAHQQKLLLLAAQGQSRDVSLVYDGSDGKKVFEVVTFISKKRAPKTHLSDLKNPVAAPLLNLASWVFQLGYYTHGSNGDEQPEFQSTYNMYENGVTTELLFTYDSYQLKGVLKTYEVLPPEPCKVVAP